MGCQDEVVIPQVERPVGDKWLSMGCPSSIPMETLQLAVEDVPRHPGFKKSTASSAVQTGLPSYPLVLQWSVMEMLESPRSTAVSAEQGNPVAPSGELSECTWLSNRLIILTTPPVSLRISIVQSCGFAI